MIVNHLILVIIIILINVAGTFAQKLSVFATAITGRSNIDFPEAASQSTIGDQQFVFSENIRREEGRSYGFESGIGIEQFFFIYKYRTWNNLGAPQLIPAEETENFSSEAKRSQKFNALGIRFFLANISKNSPTEIIFPFVGGGLVQSNISESLEYKVPTDNTVKSTRLEGIGYFLEGGADILVGPFTVKMLAEYSKIRLKNTLGIENKETGGGLFYGGGISFYSR